MRMSEQERVGKERERKKKNNNQEKVTTRHRQRDLEKTGPLPPRKGGKDQIKIKIKKKEQVKED